MSADPTRLDPPIVLEVPIDLNPHRLPDGEGARVLLHLCALHGHPNGLAISEPATPEHTAAAFALARGRVLPLLVTHIDRDGRPTFALALAPSKDGGVPVASAR